MASYGFEARNSVTGRVQIDQNYRNLAFRESLSCTTAQASGYVFYKGQAACALTDSTVIAYRTATPAALVRASNNQIVFCSPPGQSASIEIFVFDQPDRASQFDNSDYGLIVHDAGGRATFDSRKRYLKVIDYQSGDNGSAEQLDMSLAASSTAAVVQGTLAVLAFQIAVPIPGGGPGAFNARDATRILMAYYDSSGMRAKTVTAAGPQYGAVTSYPNASQPNWSYLVADVDQLL